MRILSLVMAVLMGLLAVVCIISAGASRLKSVFGFAAASLFFYYLYITQDKTTSVPPSKLAQDDRPRDWKGDLL